LENAFKKVSVFEKYATGPYGGANAGETEGRCRGNRNRT
jgi:hypothetical protein